MARVEVDKGNPYAQATHEDLRKLALRVEEVLQSPDVDGLVYVQGTNTIEETSYFLGLTVPDLEREAANLFRGVIPADMTVTIYCWREKDGGADFHARYLLTEKGGIGIDAGFSAEGNHQTTDMHLMSFEFSQEKIRAFTRAAIDYELVGRSCGSPQTVMLNMSSHG